MKKGDLALSTSAIVVLIVAIVVLGFIVTFAVGGFSSLEDKLEKEALSLPEPPRPTSLQPITISTKPTAQIGGDFVAKVSVYNPCGDAIKFTPAMLSCTDPSGAGSGVDTVQVLINEVQPGQTTTVTFLGEVVATSPGRSLCTLEAVQMTPSSACPEFNEAKATVPVEFIE